MFDVFVIESGPGGYMMAKSLIENGKKVSLIEKDLYEGVCLNARCIPKGELYHINLNVKVLILCDQVNPHVYLLYRMFYKAILMFGIYFAKGGAEV